MQINKSQTDQLFVSMFRCYCLSFVFRVINVSGLSQFKYPLADLSSIGIITYDYSHYNGHDFEKGNFTERAKILCYLNELTIILLLFLKLIIFLNSFYLVDALHYKRVKLDSTLTFVCQSKHSNGN
ncbi:hypothetical protein BLOT_006715 [Blomia tropicalis]|nr:hypothetical protein BLOT_006715 [Blomia tropicalis]